MQVLIWALTLGVVWMAVVAISPWQSSRYLMAKNEHVALRSGFVAMAAVGVLYVFLMFGAFAINIFNPEIAPSEIAFIWAAENVLPPVLGILAVTGIVAAGLSSAAAFLSLIGFSAAHDVLAWRAESSSDSETLRFSRLVMLGAGVVVLLITIWAPPAVLTIGYFAATLFAAAWGPVAIWSIRSAKLTARGALWGMVAGFVGVGVLSGLVKFAGVTLPVWADPVLLGFALSIGATLVGNLGQTPSAAAVAFRESILATPEADLAPAQLRWTRYAAVGTALSFVFVLVVMVVFYAGSMADVAAAGG